MPELTSISVIRVGITGMQGATGIGIPAGGTTGQTLQKASEDDYDTEWSNAGSGDMQAANNLSDLEDAAEARSNLGLGTMALQATGSYYTIANISTSGQSNVHFGNITNKPTTLSGYGITDAATFAQGALADTALQPSNNLSELTDDSAARTNLGLGTMAVAATSDYYTITNISTSGQANVHFGNITNTPTTRSGYGITDAASSDQGALADTALQPDDIGVSVQGYDADTLKADTADVLTAGFAATIYDAGTQSTGTFTPNEANGNFQAAVNGGAHTLAPPSNSCTLVLQYTNNSSAGAVTTSGFTMVTGDEITTTDGDDFLFYVTKHGSFSHLHVQALQ